MILIPLFLAFCHCHFSEHFEHFLADRFEITLETAHFLTDQMKQLDNYPAISEQITDYLKNLEIGPSPYQESMVYSSDQILFENETIRVLKIINKPFEIEPFHTHQYHSINVSFDELPFTYYNGVDGSFGPYHTTLNVEFYEPEALHAVKNIGDHDYVSLRIEIKK